MDIGHTMALGHREHAKWGLGASGGGSHVARSTGDQGSWTFVRSRWVLVQPTNQTEVIVLTIGTLFPPNPDCVDSQARCRVTRRGCFQIPKFEEQDTSFPIPSRTLASQSRLNTLPAVRGHRPCRRTQGWDTGHRATLSKDTEWFCRNKLRHK